MPVRPEEIASQIRKATVPAFLDTLTSRAQSDALVQQLSGVQDQVPSISNQARYDFHSYGYTLLGLGLHLLELNGDADQARIAFERSANALEAAIPKDNSKRADISFHCVVAAASFHFADHPVRASALLRIVEKGKSFSQIERILIHLMHRNLIGFRASVLDFNAAEEGSDDSIISSIEDRLSQAGEEADATDESEEDVLFAALDTALTGIFFGAMSLFLLALDRSEQRWLNDARTILSNSITVCGKMNMLRQWWFHRIANRLLADIWSCTFHERVQLPDNASKAEDWSKLRKLFIATMQTRQKSEFDLLPSEKDAAIRSVDQFDDLVISLASFAGRERIGELCTLRCLAGQKRVVFVTPNRARLARTESALRRTFGPLGKSVGALYGGFYSGGFNAGLIREREVIVVTMEDLDFALRNEPTLLGDVELLIFGEGHMIGLNEHDARYELQVHQLLRRADASRRRVVYLSDVSPNGKDLGEFSTWLPRDQSDSLIRSEWRPTRVRVGEVEWQLSTAQLTLKVDADGPKVRDFIIGEVPRKRISPKRYRRRIFPSDQRELCIATAWRLSNCGQAVLIYCPEQRSVEPFAEVIIDLHERDALKFQFEIEPKGLSTVFAIGQEWLGAGSAILECLRLGVAIHHDDLPVAYRAEVERLVHSNFLKIVISSSTFTQGVNVSIGSIIMFSLHRGFWPIRISDFNNVIGRVGRAHLDVDGLVLYPMFDKLKKRKQLWDFLCTNGDLGEAGKLETFINSAPSMSKIAVKSDISRFVDYVKGGAEDVVETEVEEVDTLKHRATLDLMMLSLINENELEDELEDEEIYVKLDEFIQSSLWYRHHHHMDDGAQDAIRANLLNQYKQIRRQSTESLRESCFLSGIGLEAGRELERIAEVVNGHLRDANEAISAGEQSAAIEAIGKLAKSVFTFFPFKPDVVPENWHNILDCWLLGEPLASLVNSKASDKAPDKTSDMLRFVEDGVVHRLSWAMRSIRIRAKIDGFAVDSQATSIDGYDPCPAISAVETGTLNRSASTLIQAGFNYRIAAVKAVTETKAKFQTESELRQWLKSQIVVEKIAQPDWPTAETKMMWDKFLENILLDKNYVWREHKYMEGVEWNVKHPPPPATPVHIHFWKNKPYVLSADGVPLGILHAKLNPNRKGLLCAKVGRDAEQIDMIYLGTNDLFSA